MIEMIEDLKATEKDPLKTLMFVIKFCKVNEGRLERRKEAINHRSPDIARDYGSESYRWKVTQLMLADVYDKLGV